MTTAKAPINAMHQTSILAIGRHEEIMSTLMRLINQQADWQGFGCLLDEEARRVFDEQAIDIVLLSSGISEDCERDLCVYFRAKNPAIIIIQHYGGGSGLLANEIRQALEQGT